ncbi:MAG: hypothetical protein R3C05_19355 [Pirellulaceae bacterium]
MEKGLVPLMHFVLLGFLPMWRMQSSKHPAYAAGCGQLFMADARAYRSAGGHAAIKGSRHDGITLPRTFRNAGFMTDVVDGTDLADVRMYRSSAEVIRGVLKNADEALARPALIVPVTLFCFAPLASLIGCMIFLVDRNNTAGSLMLLSLVAACLSRLAAARRFSQPLVSAFLHPFALPLFGVLQWVSLSFRLSGRRIAWRGRLQS